MTAWREQRMRALASGDQVVKQFRADVTADGDTELYIYDVIDSWGGYWGISAQDVVAALQGAGNVTVHINSPGGEVFEALAIYATFRAHTGQVTMRVEGWAASAASMVAMAGTEVVMEPNGMLMIHDAWSYAFGNAADLRQEADVLDKTSQNIATMYLAKAGGDVDTWRAAMKAETWYTAQEAVDAGLADSINTAASADEDPVEVAAFANAWDTDKIRALYANAPAAVAVPVLKDMTPAAPAAPTIPDWESFRTALEGLKR
jgi:ATP-dependent protease ClpP protease subunit